MTMQTFPGRCWIPTPISNNGATFPGTNHTIDAVNEKAAFIINIAKTGNINKVHYRIISYTSSSVLDVRLETVDATTGSPSGSLWGTTTNGADTPVAAGWRTVTLTASAAVVKGDILALVVVQPAALAGNISLGYLAGTWIGGFPHAALYTGSWAKAGMHGGFGAVEYDDGTFIETPGLLPFKTITNTSWTSATNPNYRGVRFRIPMAARMRGFWMVFGGTAAATADIKLYDSDGATVLRTVTADLDIAAATTFALRTFEWSSSVDLSANTYYRLVAIPNASSWNYWEYDANTAPLMDAWGFGQDGHYTQGNNPTVEGDWSQTLTKGIFGGLILSGFDDAAVVAQNMKVHPGMAGGMRG